MNDMNSTTNNMSAQFPDSKIPSHYIKNAENDVDSKIGIENNIDI